MQGSSLKVPCLIPLRLYKPHECILHSTHLVPAGAYEPAAPQMVAPYESAQQLPYQAVYEPQPAQSYAPQAASGLLTTEPDGSSRIQLAIVGPQVGAVLGRNGANISQIRAVRFLEPTWLVVAKHCTVPAASNRLTVSVKSDSCLPWLLCTHLKCRLVFIRCTEATCKTHMSFRSASNLTYSLIDRNVVLVYMTF